MEKIISLDMDGTIVDFYGVENWLSKIRAHDAQVFRAGYGGVQKVSGHYEIVPLRERDNHRLELASLRFMHRNGVCRDNLVNIA